MTLTEAQATVVNSFQLGPTIHYGEGAAALAGPELRRLGATSALLVTDQGILDAGVCAPVEASLAGAGVRWSTFAALGTNPDDTVVMHAVRAYGTTKGDAIIAVGGGSSLDVAKSAAAVVSNGGDIFDYENGARPIRHRPPPLILVPTTAGTGSETVSGAFIIDSGRHIKMHIVAVPADVALCDPALTLGVPPAVTAATGLDALSHAIGAYASLIHQPLTDGLALYAIETIGRSLARAVKDGSDRDARADMMLGSLVAGLAMKGGGTGEHAFAHAVNALLNVHHGVGCAMFLADVMDFNRPACSERYARIAVALGVDPSGKHADQVAAEGIGRVRALVRECGIPSFRELPFTAHALPSIADKVLEDQFSLSLNPVPIGPDEVGEILWNTYLR